jgi:hypothetical protein
MVQRENYVKKPTSKLYQLEERIFGEDTGSLRRVIEQLEDIRELFREREISYKPKLRVVLPED